MVACGAAERTESSSSAAIASNTCVLPLWNFKADERALYWVAGVEPRHEANDDTLVLDADGHSKCREIAEALDRLHGDWLQREKDVELRGERRAKSVSDAEAHQQPRRRGGARNDPQSDCGAGGDASRQRTVTERQLIIA